VGKVVHTSTSAIYGIPASNPVDEETTPHPLEAYGRAKLEAEVLCRQAADDGLDVSIIRPRTILGHGRLGLMAILFELVAEGAPVFVFDGGHNRYQLVHAEDLADACLLAAAHPGPGSFNIGAREFGTMSETLEALCEAAGTGARVRSVPMAPARLAMRAMAAVGQGPFAPYHWLLYGESLWFDTSKAERELGWRPTHSNASMVIESYRWFLAHRDELGGDGRSHHQSPVRLGALRALRWLS
jgi:nucleoside-diphosphate-sugar epimerase